MSASSSIAACAQLVCDHLVACGHPLISLYLCRSDRLRCFGASGYSQVLDGFPPLAGVISATVRTGQPHIVDVDTSDIYLKAAPSVVAEICVPIVLDGTTIGALNIESPQKLPAALVDQAADLAALFADRVRQLGGIPQPTGWMYLADQATRLVRLEDPERLFDEALTIAENLSGAESSMLAVGSTADGFTVTHARGSLGNELRGLPEQSLREIGQWVDGPMACYTVGSTDGERFAGFDRLGDAGMGTLVVIALARGTDQIGFLVVADRRASMPSTELVEQLELLGSLVSSALTNARHVAALRDLARRDPLTGLGHNIAFGERLHQARSSGTLHAVLAIDVDHFKTVNDTHGHEHGNQVLRDLAHAMSAAIRTDDALFRTGGDEFAAVVAVASQSEALGIARRMEEAARQVGTSVSIGVALADDGHTDDLYARADAALYRAKHAGRDVTVLDASMAEPE